MRVSHAYCCDMLAKRSTVHLRPAAILAVMFLSAMAVTVLASSGMGAVHTNCSMCSFTCFEKTPASAKSACSPQGHRDATPTQVASCDSNLVEIPYAAAAWKVLDLPPPTR